MARAIGFIGRSGTGRAALAGMALLLGTLLTSGPAAARCLPTVERQDGPVPGVRLIRASASGLFRRVPAFRRLPAARPAKAKGQTDRGPKLPKGTVELTFLGHSSFLIRTAGQATAVTDYNGYIRAGFAPDIVTMNRAHDTHYTLVIEPGVKHVLKGWMENGVKPSHSVQVRDLHVSNVLTNIRDDTTVGSGFAGNSIFIFKSAGLCIVHLGHLHHRLKPSHAARVGSIDVLLAPIDDSWTLPHTLLVKVIDDFRPVVVIPMHYGFGGTLEQFLALMKARKFAIRVAKKSAVRFSKLTLPGAPTVMVLPGGATGGTFGP